MSIFQFIRIIWAQRLIIVGALMLALAAATMVVLLVPPRYKTETRLILDIIKPDPVTGQILSSPFLRAYTSTQTQLIRDFGVASRVVKDLKLADDADFQRRYRSRKASDYRDFERWASQQIIDQTEARVIEGSNIVQITFTSDRPEMAKKVADALQRAYIATSLEDRRDTAGRNAAWYDEQANKAKAALADAEMEKAAYERANGILLQDDKTDVDSARLGALALQAAAPVMAPMATGSSPAEVELAQVDADISQASKVLGPNHPQLLELRRKHDALSAQAEKDRRAAAQASGMAASVAMQSQGMLEAQKSKVLGQREKVERLKLMQDNVNLRREQYTKAASRSAELRQEAEIAETGVTPLGSALTPQSPSFPNKLLTFVGAIAVGLAAGGIVGLLLEFLARRVRSPEDLESLLDTQVLAVISKTPERKLGSRLRPPNPKSGKSRQQVVRA